MKFNILSLLAISLGSSYAYDDFFDGHYTRAELFEITDFVVPKITINLNENDLNNFFLRYQCEFDMNARYLVRNDECYKKPIINLDDALKNALDYNYIKRDEITSPYGLYLINKGNITLNEFEYIVDNYSDYSLENLLSSSYELAEFLDYSTDDASLTFELNGQVTEIPKIKFSVGGKYTKSFEKLGYNIKIKNGDLFGVKQLRLRSEAVDPSFLRDKIGYDICNRVDLPSLSVNFANLYFNDEYMGLYLMREAFKSHWVELFYGEKDTKHLYACDAKYGDNEYFNCVNDDDKITDDVDFKEFQERLATVQSRKELEKFFDVKTFMKWQALKYLFGSWDHVTNAHNSYLYMVEGPTFIQWIPLLYDFDSDFGAYKDADPKRSFNEETYDEKNPLFELLNIREENPEIIQYIVEIMENAFNPNILYPRIDKLRHYLSPHVVADRVRDSDGSLPGRIKRLDVKVENQFTYYDFLKNTEFNPVKLRKYTSDELYNEELIYGLKQWILERFRSACERYRINCSYAQEYLNEVDYYTETITYEEKKGGCRNSGYSCCSPGTRMITVDAIGKWGVENNEWCIIEDEPEEECWSLAYGYPCCKNKDTKVDYISTSTGKNLYYGVENQEWCGLTEVQCWAYKFGYTCCKNKDTSIEYISTSTGKNLYYGIENQEWCGIKDEHLCPSGDEYGCCESCEIAYSEDNEDWGFESGKWCSIPKVCY